VSLVEVVVKLLGVSGVFRAHGESADKTVNWPAAPLSKPSKLTLNGTSDVLLYTAAFRMYDPAVSPVPATQYAGPKPVFEVARRVCMKRLLENSFNIW